MKAKLTTRTVAAAQPGDRDRFIWDTETATRGFGLKVTPAGKRVYILQKRFNGRVRRLTIGEHGATDRRGKSITADSARREAVRLLGLIANGEDPASEHDRRRLNMSVGELCDAYFAEGCRTKKPSTLAIERGLAERHIKPLLGRRRLVDITRADIERFMRDVADGKTAADIKTGPRGRAIVKGGKAAANRTRDLLASMLSYAVMIGARPENPAVGVKRYRLPPRERFLSLDEISRLGDALRNAEADGVNLYAIAAIRLLLLTGARKSEILNARRDQVDIATGLLRLTDSKTGPRYIVLGAAALEVIALIAAIVGNPHLVPSAVGDGPLVGLSKIWRRIRERAGLKDVRLHDLRHSFASLSVSGGHSLYLTGKLLGHTQSRTSERYALTLPPTCPHS